MFNIYLNTNIVLHSEFTNKFTLYSKTMFQNIFQNMETKHVQTKVCMIIKLEITLPFKNEC